MKKIPNHVLLTEDKTIVDQISKPFISNPFNVVKMILILINVIEILLLENVNMMKM
jgi:hypothetical protein